MGLRRGGLGPFKKRFQAGECELQGCPVKENTLKLKKIAQETGIGWKTSKRWSQVGQ